MSVNRIVKRRAWIGDCPPVFDRAQKMRRVELTGEKRESLRTSWQEWREEQAIAERANARRMKLASDRVERYLGGAVKDGVAMVTGAPPVAA